MCIMRTHCVTYADGETTEKTNDTIYKVILRHWQQWPHDVLLCVNTYVYCSDLVKGFRDSNPFKDGWEVLITDYTGRQVLPQPDNKTWPDPEPKTDRYAPIAEELARLKDRIDQAREYTHQVCDRLQAHHVDKEN